MQTPEDQLSSGRIERFLFAPADARSAAVLRMLLAAMIAYGFWSVGMTALSPLGEIAGAAQWYRDLFLTPGYSIAIVALALLFGVGLAPRMTGLVLVVLLIPLASLSRGQQSRQVMLFALLAFSMMRSDARWSLRTAFGGAALPDAGPIWPVRLMQIQLSILYGINVLAKTTPDYLRGDVLVGLSRMRPNFLVDLSDGALHIGPLAVPVALAATASVLVEAFLAIAFWFRRTRWLAAIVGLAFHLALQQIVRIFMLDLVSLFLYLPFLLRWHAADAFPHSGQRSGVARRS